MLNNNCPEIACETFIQTFKHIYDSSLPKKTIRVTKKMINRQCWVTKGLIQSTKTKSKLYHKKLTKPTPENIQKYKDYNNQYNYIKRALKKQYYETKLLETKDNLKATWNVLKNIIGLKSKQSKFPTYFKSDNRTITDQIDIVNEFNQFFANVGENVSSKLPRNQNDPQIYLRQKYQNSFFMNPLTQTEIITIANSLKTKTSMGHDGMPTKMLKEIIQEISVPLCHILNKSIENGIVPKHMKIARVIPIYKNGNPNQFNNYRPISILPAISKLMEKAICNRLFTYLNQNDILFEQQYGFRKGHTTIHPIIHLLNAVADANDKSNPEFTLSIFIDLSKAFDTINHNILLQKLHHYGIRGVAHNWFNSYLSDRQQYVEIDSCTSNLLPITHGVPQGSILGPILFLIYINDIASATHEKILTFADDTTIYISDKDPQQLTRKGNMALNKLYLWFCANKLSLNTNKTKYIVIRPHNKLFPENLPLHINSELIEKISKTSNEHSVKFLGILLDEHLSWKAHINYINRKITHAIFSLNQVKNFLPHQTMRNLYYSIVHPHMLYGILAWGNANSTTIRKTILLQKRAIRVIHNIPYRSHTDPYFKESKILRVQDLYELQTLIFMHDYQNNKLPSSFKNYYSYNNDIHPNRITRQSTLFHKNKPRNTFSQVLPKHKFPDIWNKWAPRIQNLKTTNSIKRHIKNDMFEKY